MSPLLLPKLTPGDWVQVGDKFGQVMTVGQGRVTYFVNREGTASAPESACVRVHKECRWVDDDGKEV